MIFLDSFCYFYVPYVLLSLICNRNRLRNDYYYIILSFYSKFTWNTCSKDSFLTFFGSPGEVWWMSSEMAQMTNRRNPTVGNSGSLNTPNLTFAAFTCGGQLAVMFNLSTCRKLPRKWGNYRRFSFYGRYFMKENLRLNGVHCNKDVTKSTSFSHKST